MLLFEPGLLTFKLLQQRTAHAAYANHKHFNHLVGVEQHLMGHAYAGGRVIVIHHHRNRTLRRALGDRYNIDVRPSQRGKELRRDAAQGAHTITNNRDDGQTLSHRQRLQQAFFQLEVEFILHSALCTRAVALRDAEADAVFRRGLGDQHYRDARTRHCGKNARRHAHHAFHSRAGNAKHRHVIEVRNTFYRQIIVITAGTDQRTGRLRIAGIFNQARDLELGNRGNGARVQHFSAEVRKLHRFLIRHRLKQSGVGYLTRIASIYTVDIGPDFTTIGTQTGGQYGGRVVRAITPQHH